MNWRAVAVVIGVLAPIAARAEPPPALEQQAAVSIDYLGATGARGVSVMGSYRRPVSAHVAVTAEAGVQGASRGGTGGWSLANVTIGGIYVARAAAVRLDATVPLASDDGDAAIPPSVHGTLRVVDGERFAARAGAVAIAVARRIDRAKAFAQLEIAAVALIRGGGASDELQLRFAVSGGVRVVRRVSLIGAFTTVSGILSGGLDRLDPDDPREDFRHALDLGVRAELPRMTLSLRLQVPLDRSLRSREVYVVALAATL